jgi:hypothetical protein
MNLTISQRCVQTVKAKHDEPGDWQFLKIHITSDVSKRDANIRTEYHPGFSSSYKYEVNREIVFNRL